MPDETQLEALPPAAADDAPQQPTAVQEVPVIVLSKSSSNSSSTPRKDAKLQARKEHQERVHASKVTAEAQQLVKLSTLQKDERTDGVDIVLNTLGVPMRIERFPYVPKKGKRTSDFRTPLAVRLLLQFQCEASGAPPRVRRASTARKGRGHARCVRRKPACHKSTLVSPARRSHLPAHGAPVRGRDVGQRGPGQLARQVSRGCRDSQWLRVSCPRQRVRVHHQSNGATSPVLHETQLARCAP